MSGDEVERAVRPPGGQVRCDPADAAGETRNRGSGLTAGEGSRRDIDGGDGPSVLGQPQRIAALAAAEAAGLTDRIRWITADLATWQPDGPFDLVTAHFLQSPVELPREVILRRAAATVAPGGVLLVVGHAQFPPWSKHKPDGVPLPTADDVLASLDLTPEHWAIVTKAAVDREATGPDGQVATLVDSVLTLRRLK